jgi:glycosyltransferase involved in cell wall biosynthesis
VLDRARVAVVVPAHNEERWIAETVRRMPAFVDHVIVVDDASRDRTSREAARPGDPRVEVIRHADNRGVGAAIVRGYRRARALGAGIAAVMAGDGQMHPDDLGAVASPIARGEADYVKGNRLAYPGAWRSMPPARFAGTAALAWLTRLAAGLPHLSDSQCGFTAISARAIDALGADLDALWPRYGYPNDLLGAVARRGLRVAEVVVRPVYRGEASGLRPWHLATIGFVIGRVAYRRLSA